MSDSFISLRQLDHHDASLVRVYLNKEPDDYPAHWHRKYEIILPVKNVYTVIVDNESYEVMPGEVLIIPSGMVHELFAPPDGERYILMTDDNVVFSIDGLVNIQHVFYPCVHLRLDRNPEILEEVMGYLWQAIREREEANMLHQEAVKAYVSLFLIRIGRWLTQHRDETHSSDARHHVNETLLDVYAYVTDHCAEKLTLEGVATLSGYSKYHFARIFKEYSGMSFYEFYIRQRIMLCRRLLSEMEMPITEVAMQAGFGSISTFNRVFRQYEGMTPTQYRRMCQVGRHCGTEVGQEDTGLAGKESAGSLQLPENAQ